MVIFGSCVLKPNAPAAINLVIMISPAIMSTLMVLILLPDLLDRAAIRVRCFQIMEALDRLEFRSRLLLPHTDMGIQ